MPFISKMEKPGFVQKTVSSVAIAPPPVLIF